jgi:hypothetical protein
MLLYSVIYILLFNDYSIIEIDEDEDLGSMTNMMTANKDK